MTEIPPDIAARYPVLRTVWCDRCQRYHQERGKEFWRAMARHKFSNMLRETVDTDTIKGLLDARTPDEGEQQP